MQEKYLNQTLSTRGQSCCTASHRTSCRGWDEAAGRYNGVLNAAAAGVKPRPKPRTKQQLKPSLASSFCAAGDSDLDTPSREAWKRELRKVSVDLPGESSALSSAIVKTVTASLC